MKLLALVSCVLRLVFFEDGPKLKTPFEIFPPLKNKNINVHSVTNVTTLLQILHEVGKITDEDKQKVESFIQNNKLTNGTGTNQVLTGNQYLIHAELPTVKSRAVACLG